MAHLEQINFFQRLAQSKAAQFEGARTILEIGSQNINGSVRGFFPSDATYIGIDLGPAKDVDWTASGEHLELPDGWADVAISTECFEHCAQWPEVLANMARLTKAGGLMIITCASLGRPAHGTIDSNTADSPFTATYYRNLDIEDFTAAVNLRELFKHYSFEVDGERGDLYFWGVRNSSGALPQEDQSWRDIEARLARAQGQLAQAAERHAALMHELRQWRQKAQTLRPILEAPARPRETTGLLQRCVRKIKALAPWTSAG